MRGPRGGTAVLGGGARMFWVTLVLLCSCVAYTFAWQEWVYNSTTSDEWRKLWGYNEGPHGRRGHSMVLYGTQIILFGGRDNEIRRNHVPREYRLLHRRRPMSPGGGFETRAPAHPLPRPCVPCTRAHTRRHVRNREPKRHA